MTRSADEVVKDMISLFNKYREAFGLTNNDIDDGVDYEEMQVDFEHTFVDLICDYEGHDIQPNAGVYYGAPDACIKCNKHKGEIYESSN